jgi:long-subunit acyl-CoA synthetase (AMP-forming)
MVLAMRNLAWMLLILDARLHTHFSSLGLYWYRHYCRIFELRAKQHKVPLNPAFNAPQVLAALNHLAASHLIIGAETNLPRKEPRSNIPLLTHLVPNLEGSSLESDLVPSLRKIIIVNNSAGRIDTKEYKSTTLYEDVIEEGRDALTLPDQGLDPHDIVNIQFTSGTTSMPKAACLSHRSILNNGKSIGDRMLLTEKDIVCSPPPLFQYFTQRHSSVKYATNRIIVVSAAS